MKLTRVEHIGIVVKNLEDSIKIYKKILGLRLETIEYLKEHKVKIALFSIGETLIELIEDQDPNGEYSQSITEKGEGVHHICFQVKDIVTALRELKQIGVKLHHEEPQRGHQNSKIAFFDLEGLMDVTIELCEKPEM